ncbi:GNAT family N-acetyltransferase [Metabacillus halosaccharovorans]|uniref:GNAT family N-acetyltransferase n=1 Tax=Metabacillus halosaccharovorans TaxID=930124 RepID=UPI001C1F3A6C|nr:GNAT family N-acetyltransferase [Metabacillus halosaccharovorans]MBU7595395.1 GNAT family N-acetyltransferase [Metabacillus halosaccharovorans]
MEIKTKRLNIKPCTRDLYESDEEVKSHIQLYLEELESDQELFGWGVWLVFSQTDQQLIGDIGFKGKPVDGVVEVGYGISPDEQNKGYATEAVEALVNWAFQTGKVNKIVAETLITNEASIRVLEKLFMNKVEQDEHMVYWEKHIFH